MTGQSRPGHVMLRGGRRRQPTLELDERRSDDHEGSGCGVWSENHSCSVSWLTTHYKNGWCVGN